MGGEIKSTTVRKLRWANRVLHWPQKSRPRHKAGHLTISQVAERLQVKSSSIYYRILCGMIVMKKDAGTRCYLFPDEPSTLTELRELLDGKIERLAF